jgi:chaperone required for assembly of F1-ATPase
MHRAQPERTVEQLGRAVAARDPFELAALAPLVTISGSLIVALALVEREIDLEAAWTAATVDEAWQTEQWGEDSEAALALANRRSEFEAAARFLELVRRQ